MKDQVMEMFAQGYVVVVGSYYGDRVVESAEEIVDVFDEEEEDEYVSVSVDVDEETRRVELFVSCDE